MWTHFSCNFLLHEISLVADWVFESRPMQLHSSYACNGLISWRIGSLHPGHALSIYFVIIVGLWYSRWELDLFVTLSAEAIDLVPRCRCRLQSEWWRKESWLLHGESLIYLSLSLQRRVTWYPGVAVDCNGSDGGKRVGFFTVRAWFICHSLCRGEWLGAQVSLGVQPLSIAIGVMAERELASDKFILFVRL